MVLNAKLTKEIASAETDIYRYVFDGFPLHPDDIYSLGDGDRIYESIVQDAHAGGVIETRIKNIVCREYTIKSHPRGYSQDKRAAEVVDAILRGFDFNQFLADFMLNTLIKGNGFSELTWDIDEKTTFLKHIWVKPNHRFRFHVPDGKPKKGIGMFMDHEIRNLSWGDYPIGQCVPDKRILVNRYSKVANGVPWGVGLGRGLYWLALMFKKEFVKQRCIYLDKYAEPTVLVKPPSNPRAQPTSYTQRQSVLDLFAEIRKGGYIELPPGWEASFLEAQRSSTNDAYQAAIDWCNTEMSKLIVGETLSIELPKGAGSRAAAETHKEGSAVYLAKYDSDRLTSGALHILSDWITSENVEDAKPPIVDRHFPELSNAEDLNSRITRDVQLFSIGYRINPEQVKTIYGPGYTDTQAQQPQQPQQDNTPFKFQATDFAAQKIIKWHGLFIGVEYLPGDVRFANTDHPRTLKSGYGHIRNYRGADGEALDCYLAPAFFNSRKLSSKLFEVSQLANGEFDEHKFMIGYSSIKTAKAAYLQEMPPEFFGGIKEVGVEELQQYHKEHVDFIKNLP